MLGYAQKSINLRQQFETDVQIRLSKQALLLDAVRAEKVIAQRSRRNNSLQLTTVEPLANSAFNIGVKDAE